MRLQTQLSLQFPASDGYSRSGNYLDGYSISASFNSSPVFIGRILGYTLCVTGVGASTAATVKLQGCVDLPLKGLNAELPDSNLLTWFDLALPDPRTNTVGVSQTLSGTSSAIFIENSAMYRWVRVVWTNSSGSSSVTAHMEVKGID